MAIVSSIRATLAPRLALVLVALIGLSFAINTALIGVLDRVLFPPVPYPDADRLVHIRLHPDVIVDPRTARDLVRAQDMLNDGSLLEQRVRVVDTPVFDEGSAAVAEWGLALCS